LERVLIEKADQLFRNMLRLGRIDEQGHGLFVHQRHRA
jgi:hypothetical protein